MLDSWMEIHKHEIIQKIDKFIIMKVTSESNETLFYSIDELWNLGVVKNVPRHTEHNRKRFNTELEALEYLTGGIKCLIKSRIGSSKTNTERLLRKIEKQIQESKELQN